MPYLPHFGGDRLSQTAREACRSFRNPLSKMTGRPGVIKGRVLLNLFVSEVYPSVRFRASYPARPRFQMVADDACHELET
jgi:hypothetical protein